MNIEIRADLRDGQIAFGDSIVALSSGRLPAGVAVVRISGPRSRFALEALAGPVPDRMAEYRKLRTPDGSVLDSGLVILFPGPGSFTGEDVAEFHIHGGKAVVAAHGDRGRAARVHNHLISRN